MRLQENQIETKLKSLSDWERNDQVIRRKVIFSDFRKSVLFFNAVATIAEQMNHHPDFFNSYSTCVIELTTHDHDGLTELDFEFAKRIEEWIKLNA
jgi:4a-hydroxytetrahydrobiopterin dehydratase